MDVKISRQLAYHRMLDVASQGFRDDWGRLIHVKNDTG